MARAAPTSPNRGVATSLRVRPRRPDPASVCKYGTFAVPAGSSGWPLGRATEQAIKKFGMKLLKEGWRILAAPTIKKIKVSDETGFVEKYNADGSIALLVPTSHAMRTEDPWHKPGMDQYEIAFRVTRAPRQITYDIPQEYLERFGLPSGMSLKE